MSAAASPICLILTLLVGCQSPEAEGITVDTSYRGYPTLEAVSAECDASGEVVVRARTRGWASSGVVEIWDGSGGYAWVKEVEFVAFTEDETCDLLEWSTARAEGTEHPALATCDLATFTFLAQVWYERGCAGVVAWGADALAVDEGTIAPARATVVESGVPDEDCAKLLDLHTAETVDPEVATTALTCLP